MNEGSIARWEGGLRPVSGAPFGNFGVRVGGVLEAGGASKFLAGNSNQEKIVSKFCQKTMPNYITEMSVSG